VGTQKAEDRSPAGMEYCWEFHSRSGAIEYECMHCVVYRSRSGRCFELAALAKEIGHARFHCTDTCESCAYYREIQDRKPSVLIVTAQAKLPGCLDTVSSLDSNSVRFAESDYHCGLLINSFRPDYVIVDCSMGTERSEMLARFLSDDHRVPFVRTIMVGEPDQLPEECSASVFAFVRATLSIEVLQDLLVSLY
jgi:hypothetical protein